MVLITIWGLRKGCEQDSPEFIDGIDELCHDGNPEWFADTMRELKEGGEWSDLRVIRLRVEGSVERAFDPLEYETKAEG